MRLLNVILLLFFTDFVAASQNSLWFARIQANILCNGEAANAIIEVRDAEEKEPVYHHLHRFEVKNGFVDFVTMKEAWPSFWVWVVDFPLFYLRIHNTCGKCGLFTDTPFVGNENQYADIDSAQSHPFKMDIELSECRKGTGFA